MPVDAGGVVTVENTVDGETCSSSRVGWVVKDAVRERYPSTETLDTCVTAQFIHLAAAHGIRAFRGIAAGSSVCKLYAITVDAECAEAGCLDIGDMTATVVRASKGTDRLFSFLYIQVYERKVIIRIAIICLIGREEHLAEVIIVSHFATRVFTKDRLLCRFQHIKVPSRDDIVERKQVNRLKINDAVIVRQVTDAMEYEQFAIVSESIAHLLTRKGQGERECVPLVLCELALQVGRTTISAALDCRSIFVWLKTLRVFLSLAQISQILFVFIEEHGT